MIFPSLLLTGALFFGAGFLLRKCKNFRGGGRKESPHAKMSRVKILSMIDAALRLFLRPLLIAYGGVVSTLDLRVAHIEETPFRTFAIIFRLKSKKAS